MTVAEVIAALQSMPQDFEVLTEGCDCIGGVIGVQLSEGARDAEVDIAKATHVLIQNADAYWRRPMS